ncbi:hypothetical protein BP5796_00924 [Coleophoma crateriformis]|uniref:endo-1,3(4)-beta-glucanase n=1 Tax=Coleophoma crateriformis TaxID=565419 RepID=A0A3D8T9Q7_9HELO|nr:hypothetical protein BP5796_00924 [Coleophoma crateriformis]
MTSKQPPLLLEYWKPPKPVRHHRANSRNLLSSTPDRPLPPIRTNTIKSREDYWGYWESDKKLPLSTVTSVSSSTTSTMTSYSQNPFADNIHMMSHNMPAGPPPAYKVDREDTLAPRWWDVKNWSKKSFLLAGLALAVIIIIVVVVAVEVEKNNRYPAYSALSYSLTDTYSGTSFFDSFDYFTGYDPTSGFVHYVDSTYASQYNLTYATSDSAILRVDTSVTADSVPNASTGRFSVRLTSKTQYDQGLFIFDVKHTPYGCGTWPALWLSDPNNWPAHGEIDVMEAVNTASTGNQMTLHTSSGCTMKGVKRKETGTVLYSNCANGTNSNAGCGVRGNSTTYGTGFNALGGGVMAMELRSAGIRIWQFFRDAIPSDITSGSPDPSTWGEAAADFPNTDCNIDNHFKNQSIIANIDLCGSWAGTTSIYTGEDDCPSTCEDFVANNATAFTNAYWEFGYFKVYTAS